MFEEKESNKEKNISIEKPVSKEELKPEIYPEGESQKKISKEKKIFNKIILRKKEKPTRVVAVSKKSTKILEKSKTFQEIENILSEDLSEAYQAMPERLKEEFKKKGDKTASKIEIIISKTKVAINKILSLVRNWLLMISGVNKFFLEQQAKIKTDKILKLVEEKKKVKI